MAGRGVNILGYDPIWRARDQARLQASHFRYLREAGFDSVRSRISMVGGLPNPAGGGQAFVVDDFELNVVPQFGVAQRA